MNVPIIFLSSLNALFASQLGNYARSKHLAEEILNKTKLNYLIIRVPLIIGKNSPSLRAVQKFYKKFSFCPLFGEQNGKLQPVHLTSLVDLLGSKIKTGIHDQTVLNIVGNRFYNYREILENILNPQIPTKKNERVRFLRIPFGLALNASRLLEKLHLPTPVSSEEIQSVNLDKAIDAGVEYGEVLKLDNAAEILFNN